MNNEKKLIEDIERIIYRNVDDIAVSIARSFERLEERIDSMEARLYGRITELEDNIVNIETTMHDIRKGADALADIAKR